MYKAFKNANPNGNRSISPGFHLEAERFDQLGRQDTTGKKKIIKSKNSYQIACEYKINISESVLSDISYSRVEDSLDSDSNFEDALKRREQELVGTVKRKRISGGLSDPNVLRKEIEVTLFFVPKKETIKCFMLRP